MQPDLYWKKIQLYQGRSVVVVDVEAQSKIHIINIVTWAYSPGNYFLAGF